MPLVFICISIIIIDRWGKGLPSPDTGCPVPDVNVWATVSTIVHLSKMFLPTDFLFEQRIGLVTKYLFYMIVTY